MTRLSLAVSFGLALLPLFAAGADAPATPQPFNLQDLRRLVSFSTPQISPDGSQIAVVVSRPNWDEDKNDQEIDLVDVMTGAVRPLTYQRSGLGSLSWSPNGHRLAFTANDPDTKQSQIFVMSMAGGDPIRVTDGKEGVDSFTWSPDGTTLAFYRQDPSDEEAVKHHQDALKVTDNNFLVRKPVEPWHVWTVPAAGGKAARLTEGSWSVQTDQETGTPLAWTQDGRRVLFAKFPDSYFSNAYLGDIESVSVEGKRLETAVPDTGAVEPKFSARGVLAFLRPRGGDENNGNAVYFTTVSGSRDVTAALARNVNDYAWLPDGSGFLMQNETDAKSVLWQQPLDGRARVLDLGDVGPGGFSIAKDGRVAFVGTTPTHPAELYVLDTLNAAPRRLTHLNDFTDGLALGKSRAVDWTRDGFKEDGVLTYPVGYVEGRKYPLVLLIHGGPEGASVLGFSSLTQLLAAQGFLVFQPNYRGSTNLGDAYQHAIFRDTGEGPGEDVMAGIAAVEKLGVVDASRMAITGWSYGGYMTSWLNGRYPNHWRAAVEGAALNDWLMDYDIAYYQHGDLYFFGGSPYGGDAKTRQMWRQQSPIALAGKVKAPTLIMGDAGDNNVPIINSYEMYHALQDHGVTVEFYVYPADTHFPHDIVHTTDVYRRWVDWVDKHLR